MNIFHFGTKLKKKHIFIWFKNKHNLTSILLKKKVSIRMKKNCIRIQNKNILFNFVHLQRTENY